MIRRGHPVGKLSSSPYKDPRAVNNNIIAPTFVNGVTITVMAAIGLTAVFLIAQLFHWGVGMGQTNA